MFYERMRWDYEHGVIENPSYAPYFAVKFYQTPPQVLTKSVCNHILCETQRDLMELEEKHPHGHTQLMRPHFNSDILFSFRLYGSDRNLYAYLVEIEKEMVQLLFSVESD